MIQILPQKTNIGSQIGEALGMGIQKGAERGWERHLTNQGFDELVKSLGDSNPDLVNAINVLRQGALNPGADRATAALAPLLIGKARTEGLYGNQERGGQSPMGPAEAAADAKKYVEGTSPAGFLSAPMNPDQMQDYATRYAQVIRDPNAFDKGLQQAANLNASREQSRQSFENSARGMGISETELPRYMQLATNYQNLKDPQAINRAAFNKFQEIKNNKEALRNLSVPGIGRALTQGATGLVGSLLTGPKGRQDYLKNYDQLVKKLVNDGEEPYVRQELAQLGLSPTEVEERIHPMTPEKTKALKSLPKGNQLPPEARNKSLVNFFRENVDNETSLSVLRHYLVKDKGYDWQEVASAINQAFPEGKSLTGYQSAEMANISKAPRDSLIDIFRGTGNALQYLRGQI